MRQGLARIIQDSSGRVGPRGRQRQALLDLIREQPGDVVLLDVGLPGRSGLDVLRQIKQERPRLPVLMLSVHPADQYAVRALRAGASGYLTKDLAAEELVKAVRPSPAASDTSRRQWPSGSPMISNRQRRRAARGAVRSRVRSAWLLGAGKKRAPDRRRAVPELQHASAPTVARSWPSSASRRDADSRPLRAPARAGRVTGVERRACHQESDKRFVSFDDAQIMSAPMDRTRSVACILAGNGQPGKRRAASNCGDSLPDSLRRATMKVQTDVKAGGGFGLLGITSIVDRRHRRRTSFGGGCGCGGCRKSHC